MTMSLPAPDRKPSTSKRTKAQDKADFYTRVLDETEQLDFDKISDVEGLDNEITLFRVKIKNILEKQPDDIRLLVAATRTLSQLVKVRYNTTKAEKKSLGEAIRSVIEDIGIPLLTSTSAAAIIDKKL